MNIAHFYPYFPGFAAILLLFILAIRFTVKKIDSFNRRLYLYSIPVLLFLILMTLTLILSRAVLAEYYFNKAREIQNVQEVYSLQRQSIIINPYKDNYRRAFSQTNLFIANSLADKVNKSELPEGSNVINEMSPEDKQTATKAIQAAIEEAKAAVKLNENKAENWENLGNIYRNLLNIAENADGWAISAYQRAIVLAPNNPEYRLNLGGVYFLLKKYDEAIRSFEEAIKIKPDWANAYYNLAWAYHEKGNKKQAVANMEKTVSLLSKQNNPAELDKATQELIQFRR